MRGLWYGVGRMIPVLLTRYFLPRPGRAASDAARVYYHLFSDDVAGSTIDNVNELIPTFEDIDNVKDSYLAEQSVQELAAHVFMLSIPAPIKIGMEVYSFYDYFMND